MRIAILVRDFPPKQLGGTEIATYNIAKVLAKWEHEVLVITTLDKGLLTEGIMDNFHVHRIGLSRNKVSKYPGLILFSIKALLVLRKFKPDVIHGQSVYMGVPALISKMVIKKPYVLWLQGTDINLPGFLKQPTSKLVLSQSDAVIALTEDMKSKARRLHNTKILVIPNGVDLEIFGTLSRKEARCQLQLREDSKVITFVGNLIKIKGIRYLIGAMKIIEQECSQAQLLLIGDGIERQDLESLVLKLNLEQCITFVGVVPNERVSGYLCASDLFVLPSLSEGFPVTFLEAMACGLPILATRVRGLPEIINDGENGFLVEPRSSTQLAEKALYLLQNNTVRERISRNNREHVRRYNWQNIVKSLEEIYIEITRHDQLNKEMRAYGLQRHNYSK